LKEIEMDEKKSVKALILLSAVMSVLAGIIHFWYAPIHWLHSPAHGAFFLAVAVAQVAWGSLVWRRPSSRLYYIGAILSGWLIVLYAITRWLPSPFGHGPEGVDLLGITCKLCETLSMTPAVILIYQGLIAKSGRKPAWQTVALIIVLSIVAGFSTYTVARAAEPLFPSLTAPTGVQFHDEETSIPEHDHDN
jgi:hypothetical protein